MKYISTRDNSNSKSYNEVLMQGLSSDGGLFVPEFLPKVSLIELKRLSKLTYSELAANIIAKFTGKDLLFNDLSKITKNIYSKFNHNDVAPLVNLGEEIYLLELFYGPTFAFKDYAMQFLAADFERVIKLTNKKIVILGATSGDTGSAALNAFSKKSGIDVFILFPEGRVSEIQEAQMTSVISDGAFPLKINGNFDDCQEIVKKIFQDLGFKKRLNLSAINSINWARLVPQIVYYFYSAFKLGSPEKKVAFSVPTGNFGNIYAGWCAYQMGLPVERLICASNKNNILTRFFNSGKMEKRTVEKSYSPSMDIQVSSNFERLLFEIYDYDSKKVKEKMIKFNKDSFFNVEINTLRKFSDIFSAFDVSDNQILETIRLIYEKHKILIDPHTACGIYAINEIRKTEELNKNIPIISLACAHPSKFPETVLKSTEIMPELPNEIKNIMLKPKRSLLGPNDHKTVMSLIEGNKRN